MSWGQGDSWANQKARKQVLARDNRQCRLRLLGCTSEANEAHHLESITAQGLRRSEAVDPDTMIAVCRSCHRQVTEQQRMKAWRASLEERTEHRRARRQLPRKPHPGD